MQNAITTKHNLDFEACEGSGDFQQFRIGTCEGLWGSTPDSYYIVSVVNSKPGNGHLEDVFQWFEHSCKRDGRNLLVLEIMNEGFYKHLLTKLGFIINGRKVHSRTIGKRGVPQTLEAVRKFFDRNATMHTNKGKHKYIYPLTKEMVAVCKERHKPFPKREGQTKGGIANG